MFRAAPRRTRWRCGLSSGSSPSSSAARRVRRRSADRLDLSADEVAEAYEASAAHHTASLDVPVAMADGDGASLGDLLGDEDPGFDWSSTGKPSSRCWPNCSPRDKRILLMKFFRNMSQAQIGAEIGVSQMQVSRLLSQIIGSLRDRLEVGRN